MKQKELPAAAIKRAIRKYKAKDTNIRDAMGLCRLCINAPALPKSHVSIRSKIYKEAVCKARNTVFCYINRTSLLSCGDFRPIKTKSWYSSISNLFKGLINSVKHNDWNYLKEAANNELQN